MNQTVHGKRKLFWKEVSKVIGGEVEHCNRKMVGNRRLVLGEENLKKKKKKKALKFASTRAISVLNVLAVERSHAA